MTFRHTRLLEVPEAHALGGARLEAICTVNRGRQQDVLIDYQALIPQQVRLQLVRGRPFEMIRGSFVPRRLRLGNVTKLQLDGLYAQLDSLPIDHPSRSLHGILYFRSRQGQNFCLLFPGAGPAGFMADPSFCTQEARPGDPVPVELSRDWSPAPASPSRLVPDRQADYRRFGGNPVPVRLGGRLYRHRLFIGSLDMQNQLRPEVDAVLNLGDEPSAWFQAGQASPADRWVEQGEGSLGMSLLEIAAEAEWVLEKLRRGQRVLVNCLAGMNRSATLCTAVLIQQEGLGAEPALERVRCYHPWAHPDAYHWLRLRWMAHLRQEEK